MNKTKERRINILKTLIESGEHINRTILAKIFGFSRQDIAILKEKAMILFLPVEDTKYITIVSIKEF